MIKKDRLYWSLQVGGWAFYALVQIIGSRIAFGADWINANRIIFLSCEAMSCLVLTHVLRQLINQWRWFSIGLSRLIPRVFFSVLSLAIIIYFLRILVS